MSMQEGRRHRRRASGVILEAVATAPGTRGSRKPRRKRTVARRAVTVAAVLSVLTAMMFVGPKMAFAGGDVPEIDPTSMAGAMTLLIGGVLSLTDRNRRV